MFIRNIAAYCVLIFIIISCFYSNICLPSFIEGKQYIQLKHPIYNVPCLLEFFSFYCSHCYQFNKVCNLFCNVSERLPSRVVFYKYHVNFLGDLGKQLTHAWAVAIALGIENKIGPILFVAIQQQHSIHNENDIKIKFIQSGVSSVEYDIAWNSMLVKSLIIDQEKAAIQFQLKSIPAIFVNGKYQICNDKLDMSSVHTYVEQFYKLLFFLIEKP